MPAAPIDPYQLSFEALFQLLKNPSAATVYLYVWSRTVLENKPSAHLSHQTIAQGTGLSKSTVQKAVKAVLSKGLITTRRASATATPQYFIAGSGHEAPAKAQPRAAPKPEPKAAPNRGISSEKPGTAQKPNQSQKPVQSKPATAPAPAAQPQRPQPKAAPGKINARLFSSLRVPVPRARTRRRKQKRRALRRR